MTSTELVKIAETSPDGILMVRIVNNVLDIKNCIKLGMDNNFRYKTIIKYRGDFYIIFKGSGKFPDYNSKYFRDINRHDLDDDGKLKRSYIIGEDNFTDFSMTEKSVNDYISSLNGSTVESESDSDLDESSDCPCCRAYVWKVEVPNNIRQIKKLLRTVLCHYSNNCIPIGIYKDMDKYFIMFKSNGLEPTECVIRERYKNLSFSNKDSDGKRITRRHQHGFVMKYDAFWDHVDDLLEEFKKRYEKEGKDVCE